MKLTKEQSDWLKIIAILLMIIDHIGVVFFPEQSVWRIIGRLAFPLFAYQLAVGFQYTRDRQKQLTFLMFFALVSQIPYMLALGVSLENLSLNVFFTFVLSYGFMMLWEMKKRVTFAIALVLLLLMLPAVDYGIYGILLPVGFYLLRNHPPLQVILLVMATMIKACIGSPLQVFAIFAIMLILIMSQLKLPPVKLSKWFFYVFYPAHLTILAGVSYLM